MSMLIALISRTRDNPADRQINARVLRTSFNSECGQWTNRLLSHSIGRRRAKKRNWGSSSRAMLRIDADHYYLLSVGIDGQAFTADDVLPDIDVKPGSHVGLLVKR